MSAVKMMSKEPKVAPFSMFLTAYDPSDLPGGSLDPLGFDRGYMFLADKILPGLTNVAERPRYFSVLCAGASLAPCGVNDSPVELYRKRQECVLRFERLWALANVLVNRQANEQLDTTGIRGVSYAAEKASALIQSGKKRVDANFKMLSRQLQYGVVGIYGAVANGMRLVDRKTLALTADLGQKLGEGFLAQTDAPVSLKKAVRENSDLSLGKLIEWGRRAHVSGEPVEAERKCIAECLHRDPVRSQMAESLAEVPWAETGDSELARLQRLVPQLAKHPSRRHLREAVEAILGFEQCYRICVLAFERLLWLCRQLPSASVGPGELNEDSVLIRVCSDLYPASQEFSEKLDAAETAEFRAEMHRLDDTRKFLAMASASCGSPESLAHVILDRHVDIQRGKFDLGRRKMPWMESRKGRISLTMTRIGGLNHEPTESASIAPHPYRLFAADALRRFSR